MRDWTEEIMREPRVDPPVHPGEMLREEWLVPLGMNADRLASALGVARRDIHEIVAERRAVSAGMALRLARWSGMGPRFWLGLQGRHDLEVAEENEGERVRAEVQPLATTADPGRRREDR